MKITDKGDSSQPCSDHPSKRLAFACMDSACNKHVLACCICLMKAHHECQDGLIVQMEEFPDIAVGFEEEPWRKELAQKVSSMMKLKLDEVIKTYTNATAALMMKINPLPHLDMFKDHQINLLERARKDFDMVYSQEEMKMGLSVADCIVEESAEYLMVQLEEQMSQSTQRFTNDVEELFALVDEAKKSGVDEKPRKKEDAFRQNAESGDAFHGRSSTSTDVPTATKAENKLHLRDWQCHENVKAEESADGLLLGIQSNGSYCCAFYSLALDTACRYRLTVQSIREDYRYIDFGIVEEGAYQKAVKDRMLVWNKGTISFCGYEHTDGFSGPMPASDHKDPNGYKPGAHCIMEYVPGKSIRFYNEEGTLDISKSMEGDDETYHLFVRPIWSQNCFLIEKLQ